MKPINAEQLSHELRIRGDDWADKDAAYYALDETKKDVLSQCKAMVNDQDLSEAAKESQARLNPIYKEHMVKLVAARKAMNLAKVAYTTFQSYLELLRSREATSREEMRSYSMPAQVGPRNA